MLPREITTLIFNDYICPKNCGLFRLLNRYYSQFYRNELLCEKLNRVINIECEHNPGLNFSSHMKEELDKNQHQSSISLYLCVISYNIGNWKLGFDSQFFDPVKYIRPITESALVEQKKINALCYCTDYSLIRMKWHKDGHYSFYGALENETFRIHAFIPRLLTLEYGIRCIVVLLIKGRYIVTHCVIDPLTTVIIKVLELEIGSYIHKWSKCTIL